MHVLFFAYIDRGSFKGRKINKKWLSWPPKFGKDWCVFIANANIVAESLWSFSKIWFLCLLSVFSWFSKFGFYDNFSWFSNISWKPWKDYEKIMKRLPKNSFYQKSTNIQLLLLFAVLFWQGISNSALAHLYDRRNKHKSTQYRLNLWPTRTGRH